MMLLSNWDDKDIRDAHRRGTNTAIYRDGNRYLFFIDDWGGSMGHWGKLPGAEQVGLRRLLPRRAPSSFAA